jgi:hypothetical protein
MMGRTMEMATAVRVVTARLTVETMEMATAAQTARMAARLTAAALTAGTDRPTVMAASRRAGPMLTGLPPTAVPVMVIPAAMA